MEPIFVQRRIQDAQEWQLEELDLSGLKITFIHYEIQALEKLKALHLSNNQLKKIPEVLFVSFP